MLLDTVPGIFAPIGLRPRLGAWGWHSYLNGVPGEWRVVHLRWRADMFALQHIAVAGT